LLGAGFLIALGALGGASRGDEVQQAFVRLAAIAVIAAALWPVDFSAFRDARGPVIGFGLIYLLLLVQLIPLPTGVWAAMPGRGLYHVLAEETGSSAWRPLSISPDLTLNAVGALLPPTAIGLIALALDFRRRLLLARLIVGIGCVSALLGLLQLAAGGTSLHLFRVTSEGSAVGLFANRNHQAVLMSCCLPLTAAVASIGLQEEGSSRRRIAFAGAAVFLLVIGLAATGSRMGLLLGSIGLGSAAWIYGAAAGGIRSFAPRSRLAWTGVAVVAAVPLLALILRTGAVARLASDPVDTTRSAALRPMMEVARAFLPLGSGFGTFDPAFRRFEPDSLLSTIYFNQAHNEPVQLAIEGGLPALLLLLFFLVWWSRAALSAARSYRSPSKRPLSRAMVAVTVILLLSSLVDYPLRTPFLSGLFALACVELIRSRRAAGPVPTT
jgi:O-antigen ligase